MFHSMVVLFITLQRTNDASNMFHSMVVLFITLQRTNDASNMFYSMVVLFITLQRTNDASNYAITQTNLAKYHRLAAYYSAPRRQHQPYDASVSNTL